MSFPIKAALFSAQAGGDPKHFFDALAMTERDDRKDWSDELFKLCLAFPPS